MASPITLPPETLDCAVTIARLTEQTLYLFYGTIKHIRGWNLQNTQPKKGKYYVVTPKGRRKMQNNYYTTSRKAYNALVLTKDKCAAVRGCCDGCPNWNKCRQDWDQKVNRIPGGTVSYNYPDQTGPAKPSPGNPCVEAVGFEMPGKKLMPVSIMDVHHIPIGTNRSATIRTR